MEKLWKYNKEYIEFICSCLFFYYYFVYLSRKWFATSAMVSTESLIFLKLAFKEVAVEK